MALEQLFPWIESVAVRHFRKSSEAAIAWEASWINEKEEASGEPQKLLLFYRWILLVALTAILRWRAIGQFSECLREMGRRLESDQMCNVSNRNIRIA